MLKHKKYKSYQALVGQWLGRWLVWGRGLILTPVFFYTRAGAHTPRAISRSRSLKLALFSILFLLPLGLSLSHPVQVNATNSSYINFQARLEASSGAVVSDGYYNVEFKLYSASSGGTAEWTEDYTWNSGSSCTGPLGAADCRIQVINGYLTANLGSITSFPGTINWNQQQWLTMNIGGTVTSGSFPTMGDGEMGPRLILTAVPYAFQAGALQTVSSGHVATLSFTTPTATDSILLPDASGTLALAPASGSYIQQIPISTAANTIAPTAASVVGLTVKGTTSTAAHVLDIYNSNAAPTLQGYFDANGSLNVSQAIQPTANNTIDLGLVTAAFKDVYSANFDTGTTTTALTIGTTNAASIGIGKSGVTTTNNGALTVTQAFTANGGASVTGTFSQTSSATTGDIHTITDSSFAPAAAATGNGETITVTQGATNTSGNSIVNGYNAAATLNASGAGGTKALSEFNANAATLTACTGAGSSCTVSGFNVNTQSTGAAATITQNGLNVQAVGIALGSLNGLNISSITGGGGTENAISIGTGWDSVLSYNSTALINGTGTYVGTIATGANTINGLTLTSAADGFTIAGGTTSRTLTVTGANITVGSTITPTSAGTLTVQSNGANALTLDSSTTGNVLIGSDTGNHAKTIQIGPNATSTSTTTYQIGANSAGIQSIAIGSTGTGATANAGTTVSIQGGTAANAISIGTTASVNQLLIGSTNSTSTTTINGGTGSGAISLQAGANSTILIGTTAQNSTVQIGTSATNTGNTQTINIGNSSAAGTMNVNIGSTVAGTVTLQGATVKQAISGGSDTIQSVTTNNTAAFQVQNAAGAAVLLVDTTSTSANGSTVNYLTYPGFESGLFTNAAAGWNGVGITISQNTNKQHTYNGLFSASVPTTAANQGLTTGSFNTAPPTGTYLVSFYAKVASGTMASTAFTVQSTDGATHTCNPAAGITINSSGFQRLYCSITTTNTMTALQITQNDSTTRTIYIDAVQLQSNSFNGGTITSPTPYQIGGIQLRGVIQNPVNILPNGDSTNVFTVQNASGSSLVQVDTINNNIILNGNESGALQPWTTSANPIGFNGTSGTQVVWKPNVVTANGYIYSIGGATATGVSTANAYYAKLNSNGSTSTWSTTTSLPVATDGATVVAANGYVYVMGGESNGGNPLSTVYYAKLKSDGTIGSWTTSANPLGVTLAFGSAVTANGYLYVFGGDSTGSFTPQSAIYYAKLNADGSTSTWTTNTNPIGFNGTSGTVALNDISTVVANGYVYIIGGETGNSGTGTVATVYYAQLNSNGSIGTWTSNANALPASLDLTTSVVANGYVYVMGGRSSSTVDVSTIYYAQLNSNGSTGSWTANGNPFGTTLDSGGSVVSNGYVYYVGGQHNASGTLTFQSAVYYASTQRLQVGGTLDLVGLAGQNLSNPGGTGGTGSTGGALIAGDGTFVGNLQVQGQANFAQGVNINGTLQATTSSTAAFAVQNASGSNLLTADTTNMRLGVDVTYAAMSAPGSVSISAFSGSGGALGTFTYFYKITALDGAGGETPFSSEVSHNFASGITNQTTLQWTSVCGATGYRIYRGTTTNTETGYYSTIGTASGAFTCGTSTLTFNDLGATQGNTTATAPGTTAAYVATNITNNNNQLSVGGLGTPTGQVYVSGTVPSGAVGSISTGSTSNTQGVYVQGRYAYVAQFGANTLGIYDVSNPASPVSIATVATGTHPYSVYVQGHYAYVTNFGSNTLQIFDISNPSTPVSVSTVATGPLPINVYVQGRYAYLVNQGNPSADSFQIIDVSNPANPVIVNTTNLGGTYGGNNIYVQGRYAYIAENNNPAKLYIYDISNPSSPVQKAAYASVGAGNTFQSYVYVQGRYAYYTNGFTNTLYVVDVSNPSSPSTVGSVATGTDPGMLYLSGRYAYVVNYTSSTLQTFDISNPASPISIGTVSTGTTSNPRYLSVQGRYAYVVNGTTQNLQVYDLGGAYVQQLEAGATETSTLQVDTNATVAGDATVQGGLNVGQSLQVTGNIGSSGAVLLQDATNSATAFQVQNASGTALLTADTTNLGVTLGSNTSSGFGTASSSTAATTPEGVVTADFNGDGLPDVAVANTGSNNVLVYINTGSGIPSTATYTLTTSITSPVGVAAGDINHDGKTDLVVTNGANNTAAVYLNNTGTLSGATVIALTGLTNPTGVVLGDFNREGRPSVAIANQGGSTVSVFRNNGNPTAPFTSTVAGGGTNFNITTQNGPAFLATGDFNNDGALDLIVPNFTTGTSASLFLNAASSINVTATTITTGLTSTYTTAVGDFNGDGKPDLAFGDAAGTTIAIFNNNGSSTTPYSTTAASYSLTGLNNVKGLVTGDFNSDGKVDLAATNNGGTTVSIFDNTGNSLPTTAATTLTGLSAPFGIVAADFNGDSDTDLAVANSSNATVSTFLNSAAPGSGTKLTVKADATGVGEVIQVGSGSSADALQIISAVGTLDRIDSGGGIHIGSTLASGSGFGVAATTGTTTNIPRGVVFGDFNSDGKPDMAIANNSSNSVTVYINNGSGGFNAPFSLTAGTGGFNAPSGLVAADVNGDGHTDLVAGNFGSTTAFVWIQSGNTLNGITPITLTAIGGASTGVSGGTIAVADFNGDGHPDIAITSFSGNLVSLFTVYSTGVACQGTTGTCTVSGTLLTDTSANFTAAFAGGRVFYSDGTTDIIASVGSTTTLNMTNSKLMANSTFAILQTAANNGSMNTNLTGLTNPGGAVTADFNGDGHPDLAVNNNTGSSVSVFINNGTGLPTTASYTLTTGSNPTIMSVADFNGDGKPDLAVSNGNAAGTVSVFINSGTALPTAASYTLTGLTSPVWMAAADYNGDGHPDLAVADGSGTTNNVSIFTNTGTALPTNVTTTLSTNTTAAPYGIAAGDVNGDGMPDLAVTSNATPGTYTIFTNTNTPTSFSVAIPTPGSTNAATQAFAVSSTNGAVTLQNATNSTNAFQLQNATGTSLIAADTTDMQVTNNGDLTVGTNPGTRLVSENFESGNLNQWFYNFNSTGTFTIDSIANGGHARDGNYSGKVVMAAGTTSAYITAPLGAVTATNGTTLKERAYFYTASLGNAGSTNLLSFLSGDGIGNEITLSRNNTTNDLCEFDNGTGTTICSTTPLNITNTWFELEFDVTEHTSGGGSFQAYINGVAATGWAAGGNINKTTVTANNFMAYSTLGNWKTSAGATYTYWVDDYSADTTTVGNSSSLIVGDSLHVGGASSIGGNLNVNGALSGNVVVDKQAAEVAAATHFETVPALGYYLSADSTTTNSSFTTTFDINGVPNAADGTLVFVTGVAIKQATAGSVAHTVVINIFKSNGTYFTAATIATATGTGASTNARSFTLMLMNNVWQVVGEGLIGAPANASSTSATADFAEWIPYSGDTAPQPGDVLSVGDSSTTAKDANTPYSNRLLGVVSTSPYQVAGADDGHSVILALTGRVPVKVSLENGPIQPGDPLTSSSTPGVAMKATSPGNIIGVALEAYDGTQAGNEINAQLHVGYDNPTNGTGMLQGSQSIDGDLTISGNASIGGNLTVAGSITTPTLIVTGSAKFAGDITVGGHIITAGNQPTPQVQVAAGTGGTVTISGNDTTGTITITTTANPVAGNLVNIDFSKIYGATPRILITGQDGRSAASYIYPANKSANGFELHVDNPPQANATYTFDYFIIE